MSNLGMGVMINMLAGNESTVNSVKACLNKKIESMSLDEETSNLNIVFEGGIKLRIWDSGQSCCEHRYMRTDDILSEAAGQTFIDIELKDAPNLPNEYGDHEIQFLEIKTDKQVFTFANHNEHNGYYGGFSLSASL